MDQLTSNSAIQESAAAAVELQVERSPGKLSGWARPSDPSSNGDLIVSLMAAGATLGTLRRDRPRADIARKKEPAEIGFNVPDFGLLAFAAMTGISGLEVSADGTSGGAASVRLDPDARQGSPLGMRHGIGQALRLVDMWLEGSRNLHLRFEGSPKSRKSIDAYQYIGSKLIALAADRAVSGLTAVATLSLINPFEPVLLVFKGEDRAVDALDFIPFPSLARGGLHAAERLIANFGADDVADAAVLSAQLLSAWAERQSEASRCVTTIEIDPSVHTGLEPILNRDFIDWASGTLGISISADGSAVPPFIAQMLAGERSAGGTTSHSLQIPADSIPTLAALLRPLPADSASQRISGSYGISEWNRHGRVWSVWQPSLPFDLDALQSSNEPQFGPSLTVRGGKGERSVGLQWPLALAFREPPTRIAHTGPFEIASDDDGPLLRGARSPILTRLALLILADQASGDPIRALESLVRQQSVQIDEVIVCTSADEVEELSAGLARLVPDRNTIVTVPQSAGRIEQIALVREQLKAGKILIADASTVAPDPRTLSTLAEMLDVPGVGSAGCLLREASDKMLPVCAGYSFSEIDLHGSPQMSFGPIDPAVWRGPSTYPVIANSLGLMLVRADQLVAINAAGSSASRPEGDDLLLGMHIVANGQANLCTTIVSAFTTARVRRSHAAIPYSLPADQLARIAQSTVVVRRVA